MYVVDNFLFQLDEYIRVYYYTIIFMQYNIYSGIYIYITHSCMVTKIKN